MKTDPDHPRVPQSSDFPVGTRFIIKEFDVPIAGIPSADRFIWVNWYGGVEHPYDVRWLKVDNNWPAGSFEEWAALISDSIKS